LHKTTVVMRSFQGVIFCSCLFIAVSYCSPSFEDYDTNHDGRINRLEFDFLEQSGAAEEDDWNEQSTSTSVQADPLPDEDRTRNCPDRSCRECIYPSYVSPSHHGPWCTSCPHGKELFPGKLFQQTVTWNKATEAASVWNLGSPDTKKTKTVFMVSECRALPTSLKDKVAWAASAAEAGGNAASAKAFHDVVVLLRDTANQYQKQPNCQTQSPCTATVDPCNCDATKKHQAFEHQCQTLYYMNGGTKYRCKNQQTADDWKAIASAANFGANTCGKTGAGFMGVKMLSQTEKC